MNAPSPLPGSPVSAAIVNALVTPVLDVLQALGGLDARLSGMEVAAELPPAPCLSVTIMLKGEVAGPVVWVFNQRMARALAQRLVPDDPNPDLATCQDAVSEVANMIAGNATGSLLEAGYQVDIMPPEVEVRLVGAARLGERMLQISVDTDAGKLKMVLDIRVGTL